MRSLSLKVRDTDAPPLPGGLPADWAAGFPRLQLLELIEVRVSEPTLPGAWAGGGFPRLQTLQLYRAGLTGTLPAALLPAHPALRELGLAESRFNGTLPAEWAAHEVGRGAGTWCDGQRRGAAPDRPCMAARRGCSARASQPLGRAPALRRLPLSHLLGSISRGRHVHAAAASTAGR